MSIKDLISRKPRWQHVDPDVRVAAINDISDQEILNQLICDDPEEKVKCAAINQLSDFVELSRLAAFQDDVGKAARTQFCFLLSQLDDPESNQTLVRGLSEKELLKEIVLSSNSPHITLVALEKLSNEELLIDIACHAKTTQVRESAANKISSSESLENLQKKAKHKDKLVHNIAKTKLQEIRTQQKLRHETFVNAELIISEFKQLGNLTNPSITERTLNHLHSKWSALGAAFEQLTESSDKARIDSLRVLFDSAQKKHLDQIESLQREKESEIKMQLGAQNISDRTQKLLSEVHHTDNRLDEQQKLCNELAQQWHQLPHQSLPQELKESYYSAMTKLDFLFDAYNRWSELKIELDSTEDTKDFHKGKSESINKKLQQLHWPDDFTPPDEYLAIKQTIEKSIEAQKQKKAEQKINAIKSRQEIEDNLNLLEQNIADGHVRAANKLKGQLYHAIKNLPQTAHVHERLNRLSGELNELMDWQGYATAPKREELCSKMEELVTLTIAPPEKAERIKELHDQWKALGDSHGDQKRWYRFKQASDIAYEPCKAYFKIQSEQRHQRLEERKNLCAQLEDFYQQADWETVDWKGLSEIITTARKQWKELGAVDHAHRKSVQTRFYKVIDKLREQLANEQKNNKVIKQSLIDQVTELVENEQDLDKAIKQTIALQKQWKLVGVMDRKMDQKLWKKFRTACDQVFSKKSAQRKSEKDVEQTQFVEAEKFCQQIEELSKVPLEEETPTRSRLTKFKSEFQNLELSQQMRKKIQQRFSSACSSYQKNIDALIIKKQGDGLQEMRRKADVCQQLERKVEANEIVAGSAEELDAFWIAELELPPELDKRLNERWQVIQNLALEAIHGNSDQDDSLNKIAAIMEDNASKARLICIRMEILAEIDSPEKDQQIRMAYQVDRLKKELSFGDKEIRSATEQFQSHETDWCCLGAISSQDFNELDQRIKTAIETFNRQVTHR